MVAVIQDLHPRHQEHSEKATEEAERRVDDDFKSLTVVLECYIKGPWGITLLCHVTMLSFQILRRWFVGPNFH